MFFLIFLGFLAFQSQAIVYTGSDCPVSWGLNLVQANNDYEFIQCTYVATPDYAPIDGGQAKSFKLTECVFSDIAKRIMEVFLELIDVTVENCIFEHVRYNDSNGGQLFKFWSGSDTATNTVNFTSCVFRECGVNAPIGDNLIQISEYNVVIANTRFYSCVVGYGISLICIYDLSATQAVRINDNDFANNSISRTGSTTAILSFQSIPSPSTSIASFSGNKFCGGTSDHIIEFRSTPYPTSQETINESCVNADFVDCKVIWSSICIDSDLGAENNGLEVCSTGNDQNNCSPPELTCVLVISPDGSPQCGPEPGDRAIHFPLLKILLFFWLQVMICLL